MPQLSPESIHQFDRQSDMIAKGGIYIGGDNFDSNIMWHKGTPHFGRGVQEKFDDKWLDLPLSYFTNICSWEKMNFLNSYKMLEAINRSYVFSGRNPKVKNLYNLLDKNLGYALFQKVEQSKIDLTQNDTANLQFNEHEIEINESISLAELSNQIIQK